MRSRGLGKDTNTMFNVELTRVSYRYVSFQNIYLCRRFSNVAGSLQQYMVGPGGYDHDSLSSTLYNSQKDSNARCKMPLDGHNIYGSMYR